MLACACDAAQVLTDLTLSEIRRGADDSNNDTNSNSSGNAQMIISGSREMPIIIFSPTSAHNGIAEHNNHNHSHNQQFHRQMKALADDDADGEGEEEKEAEVAAQAKRVQADGEDGVLHRGAVLGTLPALHTSMSIKTPPKKKSSRGKGSNFCSAFCIHGLLDADVCCMLYVVYNTVV